MPKILVADDNSNIQKMVTLALAEHHMEVVAVGNGEVAVRRLPDVKPDLILADVFMPVRNGYEVCEFVKNDPQFAHIPVILLVGAFDPLDEKEAHRVCADGILKKPFVPPDPLIAMVVSTLERCKNANLIARHAEAAAAAAAAPPVRQVDIPLPPPPAVLFPEPGVSDSGSEHTHQMGPGRSDLMESQDQQMGLDTTPSWRRRAMDLQVPESISSAAFEKSVSDSEPSPADSQGAMTSPGFLGAGPQEHAVSDFRASFPETASIGAVPSVPDFANHAAHAVAPETAAAPADWPELPPIEPLAPVAHQVAASVPEHVSASGGDSGGAGWMNVVAPAPAVKNPSGWTVMLDSPTGSVPSVPYRRAAVTPISVEAQAGMPVAPSAAAPTFTPPSDSSIAAEMSRLFSGLVSPEPSAVAADAAAIEAAPPLSAARPEVAEPEGPPGLPEATAPESRVAGIEFEGDVSSLSSYEVVDPITEIGDDEGRSVTGVENSPEGLVTPIEGMTDESASQYTIGPTQLDIDDSVAVNFAGSQAADLHSPLENVPEPPLTPVSEGTPDLHAESQAAPATAAAATPAPHLDIDAAVMEAAVKRVLERLEPHLHEILSNGVLRPLIENALQKELGQK